LIKKKIRINNIIKKRIPRKINKYLQFIIVKLIKIKLYRKNNTLFNLYNYFKKLYFKKKKINKLKKTNIFIKKRIKQLNKKNNIFKKYKKKEFKYNIIYWQKQFLSLSRKKNYKYIKRCIYILIKILYLFINKLFKKKKK
jgi:hypothetical protein